MADPFLGLAEPLTAEGIDHAVAELACDAASLWALLSVETRGFGFLPDRRPVILFERHVFHKRTGGRFSASHPEISSPTTGGYQGGALEYGRLALAMQLDRRAALESASWGLGQVMGFNAASVQFRDVDEMIDRFRDGEDAQLGASVRFILNRPALAEAFRKRRWATVAFFYNGSDFAKNAYDVKLERAHDLYTVTGVPSLDVRTAQARLSFLGFEVGGVDGVLGKRTRAAILAFQRARGLDATAALDAATLDALKQAGR
jgi:hypothetical protein